jgi:hypothetical protein
MKNINYPPWLTKTYRIFGQPGERFKQAMTFGLRKCHKEFTALKDVSFDIWVKPLASSAVDYSTYAGWLESVTPAQAGSSAGACPTPLLSTMPRHIKTIFGSGVT